MIDFNMVMYMDLSGDREELFRRLRREISDDNVIKAMERVPRELFVPAESYAHAYDDIPLPIGEGQTISQPFIVGMMTQALRIDKAGKVLELGTGSGYQTAILAELAGQVVTVERLPKLSQSAEGILRSLGYSNISFHVAGKILGWPDDAPYDAILVTAAAPKVHIIKQFVVKREACACEDLDIADPIGRPREFYEEVLSVIKEEMKRIAGIL